MLNQEHRERMMHVHSSNALSILVYYISEKAIGDGTNKSRLLHNSALHSPGHWFYYLRLRVKKIGAAEAVFGLF